MKITIKISRDDEFRILYLEICHCYELKSQKNGFDNFVGNIWIHGFFANFEKPL